MFIIPLIGKISWRNPPFVTIAIILKIPAIVLLPIWIGNEFFQLFFGNARQVAYVAHIGGLMGGALFGFLILKFCVPLQKDVFDEIPEDEIAPLMERALKCIAELDMESGCRLLGEVLAKDPENIDALTHLFNVSKLTFAGDSSIGRCLINSTGEGLRRMRIIYCLDALPQAPCALQFELDRFDPKIKRS